MRLSVDYGRFDSTSWLVPTIFDDVNVETSSYKYEKPFQFYNWTQFQQQHDSHIKGILTL